MTVQQWSGVTSSECHLSHYATSHYLRRLRHIWGTSSTAGGNNSRHICRDARFLARRWCPPVSSGRWSGTNKGCPSAGRGGNIGFSCVHLDYLLIAAVYTLITFVCQVIGVPLLQSALQAWWSSGHLAAHNLSFATVSALHLYGPLRKLQNSLHGFAKISI